MKLFFFNLIILIFFTKINFVLGSEKINKLKNLLDQGLINESEFKKAISLIDSNKKNNFDDIEVKQITGIVVTDKFEKY